MPRRPTIERHWIAAVPAWGERCVRVACEHTLPALVVALHALGRPTRVLVWTDQGARVRAALPPLPDGVTLEVLPVPRPDGAFESLSNCHRHALTQAGPADRVLLLTADMVVSREILLTCEDWVHQRSKTLVCAVAMRAREAALPPVGVDGATLLEWAWENRHQMTRDCTWPDGASYDVWRQYFERDGSVVARVFLPHPLVVVPRGRRMTFNPTIDVNLAGCFSRADTHVITQPSEGAVVEVSPDGKEYVQTRSMRDRFVDTSLPSAPPFVRCTNARHRMFYEKRVVICGDGGDAGDEEVSKRILG